MHVLTTMQEFGDLMPTCRNARPVRTHLVRGSADRIAVEVYPDNQMLITRLSHVKPTRSHTLRVS